MIPRRLYTFGWLAIGAAILGLEALALADVGPGDTLSEHVWALLGVHPIIWWAGLGVATWTIRHLWSKRL